MHFCWHYFEKYLKYSNTHCARDFNFYAANFVSVSSYLSDVGDDWILDAYGKHVEGSCW